MPVWQVFLVHAATDTVSAFQDSHIKSILEQKVRTTQAGETSTYHANMRFSSGAQLCL
jgi:hypothetical protein